MTLKMCFINTCNHPTKPIRLICMDGLTKPLFLGQIRWSVSALEAFLGGTSSPSISPRHQWAGHVGLGDECQALCLLGISHFYDNAIYM